MIDTIIEGVHSWEKVHETIDIHGQIVWIYRCSKCYVRGRQMSPALRHRRNKVLTNKNECDG